MVCVLLVGCGVKYEPVDNRNEKNNNVCLCLKNPEENREKVPSMLWRSMGCDESPHGPQRQYLRIDAECRGDFWLKKGTLVTAIIIPGIGEQKKSLANVGIEPKTFALLARRSNQLS